MSLTEEDILAVRYAKKILSLTREVVQSSDLNPDRLPRWLNNANIEIGYYNNSILLLFQHSTYEHDDFEIIGDVNSIFQFLLGLEEYPEQLSTPPVDRATREEGEMHPPITIGGGNWNFQRGAHFFGVQYDYHGPVFLHNAVVRLDDEDIPTTRNIPFFMAIHNDEFSEIEMHLKMRVKNIVDILKHIVNSELGDRYENQQIVEDALRTRQEDSVVVLGSYDSPHKRELERVRDELRAYGYDSHLIIDLPNYPGMNWRDKVRAWTITSRFCILVDREASGANNEFEMLREQETILALLRPENGGSTGMIPDDVRRLSGSIESFWFEEYATERVDDAIEWAEELIQ